MESLKSYQDTPDPLILLCLKEIIKKPVNLSRYVLPPELGDLIAVAFRDHALANRLSSKECDEFFENFKHTYIPLGRIDFSGLPISEKFLYRFLEEYKEQLIEINISKCQDLFGLEIKKLNEKLRSNIDKHKTLILGDTFSTPLGLRSSNVVLNEEKIFDHDLKLKKLVLHKVYSSSDADEFFINRQLSGFLTPTMSHSLKYLDLSMCSVGKGSALMQLESLEILILYSCVMTYPDVVSTICHLKNLHVLDLSRQAVDGEESSFISEDQKLLDLIVNRLPILQRLDISGTNLVGGKDRYISAFEARMENPFQFLGLFHTANDAAYRSCIPALAVAGEANENQMLNACEAYIDRPGQLAKALSDLYNFYKTITPSETFEGVNRALDVVLHILTRHLNEEQVIIYATAALWCIVKINVASKNLNDARVRRTITSRLLDVMHYHKSSRVILINGGLTLLFLPDIIREHSRVANISLYMCREPDGRTQGFGTTLLNTLACQVGGDQKIFIGKLNAIEIMINIINAKIAEENCDETLETAWSTLWNITDETPINCQKFLENEGLEAFEKCMDKFGDNKEVLRNIMGLLGNVAECQGLRVRFMKEGYMRRFYQLLSSHIDGIECCYNACGILAHIISDGPEFWIRNLPTRKLQRRQSFLDAMKSAIDKWPINSRRNINYRSFEPIVRLLEVGVAAEAQYWAVFALTNLTRVNPSKYCPMLLPHDGLTKLRQLAEPRVTEYCVNNLARICVYQYERFEAEGTLSGLEQCDSIDLEEIKNFRSETTQGDGASEVGELLL